MIETEFKGKLHEASATEIECFLNGRIRVHGNQLFSEALSSAQTLVENTGDINMIAAFRETARLLLTGENAWEDGPGRSRRDAVGMAIVEIFSAADSDSFAQSLSKIESEDRLHSLIEPLLGQLRAHGNKPFAGEFGQSQRNVQTPNPKLKP